MGVADVVERDHLGQRAVGQRLRLGLDQRCIGPRRPADGLGGVVDQDVQRSLCCNGVRERDDLGRVAQVDPDDAQPVDPVGAVLHGSESANRIGREARGDRRVGAVAQQPQCDVHPYLRAATGEQSAPAGEVSARVALAAVEGSARRAQLVIERVDVDVSGLAGVAGARLQQLSGKRAGGVRYQLQALGLVVDPLRGAGRRQGGDGPVVGQHLLAALGPALFLDTLEDSRRRSPDRHGVRVLGR